MKGSAFCFRLCLICLLVAGWGALPGQARRVVVGDGYEYPPYTFFDERGEPAGFNIELARAIGEALGWQVEIQLAPWPVTMERLERGEIDIVAGLFYTPERAAEYGFTTHHSEASGDVFTRKGTSVASLEDLRGQRVAVQNDDIIYHYLQTQGLGLDFVVVPYVLDALRLLAVGEVDYAAVVAIPAHYVLQEYKLTNLQANGLHLAPFDYSLIVPKTETALLLELEEGLRLVKSTEQYDDLYAKWLNIYKNPPAPPTNWAYYYYSLAILGGATLLVLAWALSLRRLVKGRTADLSKANKCLLQSQENLQYANEELQASVEELLVTSDELASQNEQLQKVEGQLRAEKELLRTTLLSVGVGVVVTDDQGRVTIFNPVAEKLTGWQAKDALGKDYHEIFPGEHSKLAQEVIQGQKTLEVGQQNLALKTGRLVVANATAAPIGNGEGGVYGVVVVFRDISDAIRQRDEIEYLSYHDYLTGVFNRRGFSREMARYDQKKYLPLSLIMADVNGLKLTNDVFGHAAGDRLLTKVAHILKKVVGNRGIIARLGGDEFAIMLPQTTFAEGQRMLAAAGQLIKEERVHSLQISVSFGLAVKDGERQKLQDVLNLAEERMYSSKILASPSRDMIDLFMNTLFEKKAAEKEHSYRVAALCQAMGESLGLDEQKVQELYTSGLLHNIGKVAAKEDGLQTPVVGNGQQVADRHPELGYRILRGAKHMEEIAWNVLAHHERYDGQGFPKGLKGDEIPFPARVIAIADAYEAMTNKHYGPGVFSKEEAAQKLESLAGSRFDPQLLEVFLKKVLPQFEVHKKEVDQKHAGGESLD